MRWSSVDTRLLGLHPGDVPARSVGAAAALGVPILLGAAAAAQAGGVMGDRLAGSLIVAWQSFVLGLSLVRSSRGGATALPAVSSVEAWRNAA